jgi:hypothetical protein
VINARPSKLNGLSSIGMRPLANRAASPDSSSDSLKALSRYFILVPDMSSTDDLGNLLDPSPSPICSAPSQPDGPTPDTTRYLCNSPHITSTMIQCDSCKLGMHPRSLDFLGADVASD